MRILTVYNTCGLKRENVLWYSQCIQSVLDQNYPDNKVVVSACKNSDHGMQYLKNIFGDSIDICKIKDLYTVNVTFNKTVQEMVKKYGEFDAYLYVDSGVIFNHPDVIKEGVERLKQDKYAMISFQTDTDTGLAMLGYKHDCPYAQITGEDLQIPLGKSCNLHVQFFSNDLFKTFDKRIIPDVFRAYCTESTFAFQCSAIHKEWTMVKDILLHHNKGVDGATIGFEHHSKVHRNGWNNLLYDRDALDFINDEYARSVGLGYEECEEIMMHDENAYDGFYSKHPKELTEQILKYFYTTKEELDYHKIEVEHV